MLRSMVWKRHSEISRLELSCGVPPYIMGATSLHCPSPRNLPDTGLPPTPPNVSDKAQGNLLYDFLYNLPSASVWDEHSTLSLEGEKESVFDAFIKYIAASLVKISSWQVTEIYRRERNSLTLVSLRCGFFLHF